MDVTTHRLGDGHTESPSFCSAACILAEPVARRRDTLPQVRNGTAGCAAGGVQPAARHLWRATRSGPEAQKPATAIWYRRPSGSARCITIPNPAWHSAPRVCIHCRSSLRLQGCQVVLVAAVSYSIWCFYANRPSGVRIAAGPRSGTEHASVK